MAGLFIEMNQALNEGRVAATQDLTAGHRGTTPLKDFLKGFAAAYQAG
jgi:hypothetical protein